MFFSGCGNGLLWKAICLCFLRVSMWRYVQIRRLRFVSVYKDLNGYANKEFIPCSFSFYLYFGAIMTCVKIHKWKMSLHN